jgi:hypothetical protein
MGTKIPFQSCFGVISRLWTRNRKYKLMPNFLPKSYFGAEVGVSVLVGDVVICSLIAAGGEVPVLGIPVVEDASATEIMGAGVGSVFSGGVCASIDFVVSCVSIGG